jgi:CelD/BcsL family acetyltransferase involved in cellulose biosynthesis
MLAEIRLPESSLAPERSDGRADAAAMPAVWVETATTLQEARAHSDSWRALAERASVRNIFYEPWNLLAALDTVASSARFIILFVYREGEGERQLIGMLPLERKRRYKGVPASTLELFRHIHCFLCTPLVAAEHEDTALDAFADWLALDRSFSVLQLGRLSSAMGQKLQRLLCAASIPTITADRSERAIFRPQQSARQYLNQAMSGRNRKDLRRKEKRLGEIGRLEYRVLAADEDAQAWIDAFLRIEQQGWKGRAGTALACQDQDAAYFRRIVSEAHALQQLEFVGYFLDDEPLALSCKFRAGDGAFAFKITFDKNYSRFSPGMLLELAYIVRSHDDPTLRWMDSCAESGHRMANRLWSDRRGIDTLVAASGIYGRLLQIAVQAARSVLFALRHLQWRPQRWLRVFQNG